MLMTSAPRSLDPARDDSTQGAEVNWLVYTGLTTYAHASGARGAQLIPGVATTLPVVSADGRVYTVTLRKGLVYSNGDHVRASDFAHTVQRAIRLRWAGAHDFILPLIVGARAYARDKATSIAGIETDNQTGQIVIRLTTSYPGFANVLAFPALGLVPASVPFRPEPTTPPPGIGPYEATNILPGRSFSVVQNPRWATTAIPGIPAGSMNVNVKIDRDVRADALAVLDNRADVLDWVDPLPARVLAKLEASAPTRLKLVDPAAMTEYIFRDGQQPPLDTRFAREALRAAQTNAVSAERRAGVAGRPRGAGTSPEFTEFVSARLDFAALILNPVYGWDLSSFALP
jgi:peptide/nickel transport system substrate-binding protein